MPLLPTHWTDESDEISVELVPAEDVYPETMEAALNVEDSLDMIDEKIEDNGEDNEDEVEMPRAIGEALLVDDITRDAEITLTDDLTNFEEAEQYNKTKIFIRSIKENGEWARSIPAAKLSIHSNPYLTKENLNDLLNHCITKVNFRPRSLTITSKTVTLTDIYELLKLCFTVRDKEKSLNNSIFRIYCRNATQNLKELTKILRSACSEISGVRLIYNDIYGELKTSRDSVIRFRTSNVQQYCVLEEIVHETKMTIRASFAIKRPTNPYRDVFIHWHDEYKDGHGRVTYVHFDHNAYREIGARVDFEKTATIDDFDIGEKAKMIPVGFTSHPVQDLIEFLEKLKPAWLVQ